MRTILRPRKLLMAIAASIPLIMPAQDGRESSSPPTKPEPRTERWWLEQTFKHKAEALQGPFDVCFLGDSLTEYWLQTGKALWEGVLPGKRKLNLGIAGDRTEHLLFRIAGINWQRARPKVVVLMIGTNNLSKDPPDEPEDVAEAIRLICGSLIRQNPGAKVLVLGLSPNGELPSSPLRKRIQKLNTLLAAHTWPTSTTYLSTYSQFVNDGGDWLTGLTIDGTHYSEAGYQKLAELLTPHLQMRLTP